MSEITNITKEIIKLLDRLSHLSYTRNNISCVIDQCNKLNAKLLKIENYNKMKQELKKFRKFELKKLIDDITIDHYEYTYERLDYHVCSNKTLRIGNVIISNYCDGDYDDPNMQLNYSVITGDNIEDNEEEYDVIDVIFSKKIYDILNLKKVKLETFHEMLSIIL